MLDWGLWKEKYKRDYGDRFEFIPRVPPEKVQHLIRSADVIVGQCNLGILSFCELQAMSCAKPVVCSFSYEEAYSTPPPVCQATTSGDIDAHLENLFQHSDVGATLGRKAREWVIKNHDSRSLSKRLERLYQSIVEVPVGL